MSAPRWTLALVGALAAALSFSSTAWAAGACDQAGYAYAGIRTVNGVRGIRAVVTPQRAPIVQNGQVAAWVGIGRATVGGKRGALRAGLLVAPAQPNRLYYEVRRAEGWHSFVGPSVQAGERHRIAIIETVQRQGRWRVWIDGRPVSRAFRLGRSRDRLAIAAAETWSDRDGACSALQYRFAQISLTTGRGWKRLHRGQVIRDRGFYIVRPTTDTFVAITADDPVQPVSPDPAAPPAESPELFVGNWETGDESQWTAVHRRLDAPLGDQFAVVTDPAHEGSYAARFTVRPGDKFGGSSGERCEVLWFGSDEGAGEEHWYAWSTLFPASWTAPKGWGIFFQWHSAFPGVPPIVFNARDDTAVVDFNTGELNERGGGAYGDIHPLLDTLSKGLWNDFVVFVRWRADATGAFKVWHREGDESFSLILSLENIPTLQVDGGQAMSNYLKLGLYRDADTKTDVLYHDGFRRGPRLTDVRGAFGDDAGFDALVASNPS